MSGSPLTPRTMASLRRLSISFMQDSGTILRQNLLDDGGGGTYPDPSGPTRIGPIMGLFWTLSGDEAVMAAQLGQHGRERWAVPIGTDIRATDQVELLGWVYNVVWVPPVAYHDADRIIGLEEAYQLATVVSTGAGYRSPLWILGIGAA